MGGGTIEPGSTSLLPGGSRLGGVTSLDVGSGVLGALGCGEPLVGAGGRLVPLGSGGGGGVSDVSDNASLGGVVEPDASLLRGSGVVLLDAGPGVLGCCEPLVDVGGGVSEVSDGTSLGGVIDPPSLLPGPFDPGDGSVLGSGASLDGPGVLGMEVGDWLGTGEGTVLVAEADSSPDTSEPSESNDSGDPLGGDGTVPELSVLVSLGVVSDVAEDGACDPVGLVDAVDGVDTGEVDGVATVDGPSVDDVVVSEPELGTPDTGDARLLPGVDVGDMLGADGIALLGGVEG